MKRDWAQKAAPNPLTQTLSAQKNTMSIESFQKEWKELAKILDLHIELNFPIQTAHSHFIAPVLLRNFGAKFGMILVTDFQSIKSIADELYERGYGFSTLSEPSENEKTDKESTMEMLYDWGWSGSGEPPSWYDKSRT